MGYYLHCLLFLYWVTRFMYVNKTAHVSLVFPDIFPGIHSNVILCDANCVGFTTRHLHQRISEHRYSAIGRHLETHHGNKKSKEHSSL